MEVIPHSAPSKVPNWIFSPTLCTIKHDGPRFSPSGIFSQALLSPEIILRGKVVRREELMLGVSRTLKTIRLTRGVDELISDEMLEAPVSYIHVNFAFK